MEKYAKQTMNFVKRYPVAVAAVVLAVIGTISVLMYQQSQNSALQRMHQESDSKLASQIQESKKLSEARKAKIAAEKKAAEEAAAKKAAEEKAAAEAEAQRQAEAEAQKKYYQQPTEEKKKPAPTYTEVGVSLTRSGSTLTASIAAADSGTCYFSYKKYVGDEKVYGSGQSSATNGTCSHTMSGDGWIYASVKYISSDGTMKGYASI